MLFGLYLFVLRIPVGVWHSYSWWEPILCIYCIIMRSSTCYIFGLFDGSEFGFYEWFWGARDNFRVIYQLGKWLRAVFRGFFIVFIIFDLFSLGMILESELGLWFLYIVHSPHYEDLLSYSKIFTLQILIWL